ncbi:iron ABC transporter substrate-binding protein [Salisaeta longa]|uniref:iron ABC transporter substrate-binding protein n=1 Tax=Salisaeta longa TaxID=503170 RepID=UPI0003B7AEAC|nr:iron ABC transporter substrate-binding protein [Salisaeta longa]
MIRRSLGAFALLACLLVLSACQSSSDQKELVIYSGRSMALVDSLVEVYRQQTGTPVSVKYGSDAQLLAALNEEGSQSPADVFWANTTGALTQAQTSTLLTQLPDSLLNRPARFVPSSGQWLPVTTRFRVLAYNSDTVTPENLPASVLDLPSLTQFEGRVGWTPAYSSFQDFVTAMRVMHGADTTRTWLNAMQDLNPKAYTSNTPMIKALAAGEIDIALTNHYYVLRLKHGGGEGEYEGHEEGEGHEAEETTRPNAPVGTYHFAAGDVGNLALVTGAARLQTSDQPAAAADFLRFLLSEQAQRFAATSVNEYPVVSGVQVPAYMTPVDQALELSPTFDFQKLSDLDATLELLRNTGLL